MERKKDQKILKSRSLKFQKFRISGFGVWELSNPKTQKSQLNLQNYEFQKSEISDFLVSEFQNSQVELADEQ